MTQADYIISIQDCFYTGSSRIVCKNKSSKNMSQAVKNICSRMSLEHTTEKIASVLGAFHPVEIAQNNEKRDTLARVLFESKAP